MLRANVCGANTMLCRPLKTKQVEELLSTILPMLISMKFRERESEIEGVNNTHRLINEVMNEWIDTKMVQDTLNENNDAMNRN